MAAFFPKVTFGIIVLNGEPFTRYCLRALYPFAYEIIVVEGAVPAAAPAATPEGHSLDGTLEALHRFKLEEDPEDKVQIVTRSGFWSEKDEQSQAYAERATGDYLWQVDVDEFYKAQDMQAILTKLSLEPDITAVSFKQITFWGGFNYLADGFYLRQGANIYHRLFKWGKGYRYGTHRPPTVYDLQGRNLRSLGWLNGTATAHLGIILYHYSLLFPKQVAEKTAYYERLGWAGNVDVERWVKQSYLELQQPYRVHNVYKYPSWLERYAGTQPEEIEHMRSDLQSGKLTVELRRTDDIEQLLNSRRYQLGRAWLKWLSTWDRRYAWGGKIERLLTDPLGVASRRMQKIMGQSS
jgi:hypothetical protein